MNKFIGIFIAIVFLLQFSFFPFVGAEINLLLIFVIILAQKRFDFSGIFWIFISGILMDIFSAQILGVNLLSFILVAFITSLANSFFVAFESNRFINSVIYLAGKLIFDFMRYYLGAIFVVIGISNSNVLMMPKIFSFGYLLSLIIFAIVAVILLMIYEKLEKFSGEKMQTLIIDKK